jgi:hypothetical protein
MRDTPENPVTLGLDLGQKSDPSAIAVVQAERRTPGLVEAQPRPQRIGLIDPSLWTELSGGAGHRMSEWHHVCRHVSRWKLDTPYPLVVKRVCEIALAVFDRTGEEATLYVDATGVGTPVVDALRDANVKAHLIPVYFTHGNKRS